MPSKIYANPGNRVANWLRFHVVQRLKYHERILQAAQDKKTCAEKVCAVARAVAELDWEDVELERFQHFESEFLRTQTGFAVPKLMRLVGEASPETIAKFIRRKDVPPRVAAHLLFALLEFQAAEVLALLPPATVQPILDHPVLSSFHIMMILTRMWEENKKQEVIAILNGFDLRKNKAFETLEWGLSGVIAREKPEQLAQLLNPLEDQVDRVANLLFKKMDPEVSAGVLYFMEVGRAAEVLDRGIALLEAADREEFVLQERGLEGVANIFRHLLQSNPAAALKLLDYFSPDQARRLTAHNWDLLKVLLPHWKEHGGEGPYERVLPLLTPDMRLEVRKTVLENKRRAEKGQLFVQ
ncbi:hypothetical protein ACFL5U_00335 [Candidatus Margulisiibacteriota bacterium]